MILSVCSIGYSNIAIAQTSPVATALSKKVSIPNRVQLIGSVVSRRASKISTDIGGLVREMKVDIGAVVEEGQSLVLLDEALARLELQRAEAATREAREALAEAERDMKVGRRLAKNKNLPQNELDAREARVRVALAVVERLTAEEGRQKERVERHTILAPFSGVVAQRNANEGEWIAPGSSVLELVDMQHLNIDVPVPQKYYTDINTQTRATVAFDALPQRTFVAETKAVVPVSDPTARTFILRLLPEVGNVRLTPGMSARITLELGTGKQGVVVPRDAIIRYPDGRTTLWLTHRKDDNITVTEQLVDMGVTFDEQVHVLSGLKEGTEVIVRGNEALREGQSVRLVNGKS